MSLNQIWDVRSLRFTLSFCASTGVSLNRCVSGGDDLLQHSLLAMIFAGLFIAGFIYFKATHSTDAMQEGNELLQAQS